MKKIIILILTLTYCFSQEAIVQFVIGKVEYQVQGKGAWKRLLSSSRLSEGDQLRSSFESRAEIKMPDETIIKLKENSLLEIKMIKEVGNKKKANKIFLWAGSIWAKFKKVFSDEEENTVSTVTAVAAIRGTEFGMEVNSSGCTIIRLKSGRIEIR
ncbi:MAG: FecR domain-containing protein, partial [Calditrichaeota bacterium]|nr:FecR domain-containing protein [Calditrichota bacterium]